MKKMGTKFSALLAAVLLLCSCFCGCKGENRAAQGKLRVCIDVGEATDWGSQNSIVSKFLQYLENKRNMEKDFPINPEAIEFEIIPSDESQTAERAAMLQRIRTEIMTGSGPDVFLCAEERASLSAVEGGRLFPYVDKAIGDGLFLPLDEYFGQWQYTNWQDYPQEIMNGGKDGAGNQLVVPLTFSIPVLAFAQADVPPRDDTGKTWDDALSGDDPVLSEQVRFPWIVCAWGTGVTRGDMRDASALPNLYPDFIDFSQGKLCLTQQELNEDIKKYIELYGKLLETEPVAPYWTLCPSLMERQGSTIDTNIDMTLVPLRNTAGGATAVVSLYCAINRNTKQPEEACRILDVLLSADCWKNVETLSLCGPSWMPANQAVCTEAVTGYTENTLKEWQKAIRQVNIVQFPSAIDSKLTDMMMEIEMLMLERYDPDQTLDNFVRGTITDQELADIVEKYYTAIERMAGET